MTPKPYLTLKAPASIELLVQKSRFIGLAAPAGSEEEALNYITGIRGSYRDASHHCYAYVIGQNAGIMRYQDDGEPSGTAGQPIMEALKAKQAVNACVVVVRYFGGILLGAGGLSRAYGKSAAMAVAAAGIVSMEPSTVLRVKLPYALWDRTLHRLGSLPVVLGSAEYGADVETELKVRIKDQSMLQDALMSISDGKAAVREISREYYAWPEEAKA